MTVHPGNPREAFIAGFYGGHIDSNASPIELFSYIDGEITRETAEHE